MLADGPPVLMAGTHMPAESVVATARAEAAAAAMTAVKDYGVSIAGGAASKT